MSLLDEIRATKQREIADLHSSTSLDELERRIGDVPEPLDVLALLPPSGRHVIAEVKRASPSKGIIDDGLDPVLTAKAFVAGGAGAVSVLTDQTYFRGSADDLRSVRNAVRVPILRKDFILDPLQLYESRLMGADIILLIVRLLSDEQLSEFRQLTHELGMTALCEAHTSDEIVRAVDAGASLIGVNNRDLDSFTVSLNTSLTLRDTIPAGVFAVSESGILNPSDATKLFDAGYDAVLIGEGLVRAPDKALFLRQARGS